MTVINAGAAVRVRATFRDGGKLYDPRSVAVDIVANGVTRRVSPASGDVSRESQGVYSVVVGSGSGPTLTVTFLDLQSGAQSAQTFSVVPAVIALPLAQPSSRSDAAVDAVRAKARQQNERDAAERTRLREESETARLAQQLREKAQLDAAQEARDRDTALSEERARTARLRMPYQRR